MEWKNTLVPCNRFGHCLHISASGNGRTWEAIQADLVEFWQKVCASLEESYAANAEPEWNTLYCMMRFDCGQIIAYPAHSDRKSRIDRVSVIMESRFVEEEYFKLPSGNEVEFNREHGKLSGCVREALAAAAAKEPAATAMRDMKAWHACQILIIEYDDMETAVAL